MTQEQCLKLPHHWTHYGVCYPGGDAGIQIHSADPTGVPEPATFGLLALGLLLGYAVQRFRCHYPSH